MSKTTYHAKPGDVALDAVPWFFRERLDRAVAELAAFDKVVPVQERVPTGEAGEAALRQNAALYGPMGVPFWEGALLASAATGWDHALLTGALFHQEPVGHELLRLDAGSEALREQVGALERRLTGDQFWAVTSRLGSGYHCPMLDFALGAGERNREAVRTIIRALGIRGMLVHSGASYHFYGYPALHEHEWRGFLGRALLYSPLVDGRWIAHQLQQGFCALRLTSGGRGAVPPTVAEHV